MADTDFTNLRAILQDSFSSIDDLEKRTRAAISQFRETEIILRRARDRHFPQGYFADVAWDILLDLDRAARDGQQFATTDLGVEAGVPLTTTLRYLQRLEADGFIMRAPDPADRRRSFVRLTEVGQAAMNSVFDSVTASAGEDQS
jgi:DNA-binding MarR family transcriptional regulator